MAQSYLRLNTVGYPQQANPRGVYAVKIIDNEVLADLQSAVNEFLFGLPSSTNKWTPHIISVEYDNYITVGAMPVVMHVCTITIYVTGTVATLPIT